MASPRSSPVLRLALFLCTGSCACSLLLPSGPGGDPDGAPADGDADGDGDGDGDGDADVDGDGDGDVDADGDEDLPPGEIAALRVTIPGGGHPAGTSLVLIPVVSWNGAPVGGVEVVIEASEGGLVSFDDAPGAAPSESFETTDAGGLPPFRVTFPLAPGPYEVSLSYSIEGDSEPTPFGNPVLVVEPNFVTVEVTSSADEMTLPEGLLAEEVARLGECPWENFDGRNTQVTSIAVTSAGYGDFVVVSCRFSAWFLPSGGGAAERYVTRPAEEDDLGPDTLEHLAFVGMGEAGASTAELFGLGVGTDAGGGVYRVPSDGTLPARVVDGHHAAGIDVVTDNSPWVDGLYWGGGSRIRRLDPSTDEHVEALSGWSVWPQSLAVGSVEAYGDHSLFVVSCSGTGCETGVLERANVHGDVQHAEDLGAAFPKLVRSPGMVFGRLVYVVGAGTVAYIAPADGFVVTFEDALTPGWSSSLVDGAFQTVEAGVAGSFPPGLYVLEAVDRTPRIIRIFQDLS